ncbi:MAG TPA: amino acid adenylation domain-containing protein [Isosphaeraceae bacterium]|nr:amino acid adenylation domain-containing protein [Isosphaeraceae bacterium]
MAPLQEGLLFHSLLAPHGGDYVVQLAWRVEGALDASALRRAWQQVLERHAALRTSFLWREGGEPLQVVWRRVVLPWHEEDWRGQAADEQQRRRWAWLAEDRRRGFDLDQPPLMRLAVCRLGERDWEVVWSSHHALLDGWSMALVLGEVFAAYTAFVRGEVPQLPARRPYQDYIAWLLRQDAAAARAFWRGQLGDWTAATPLGIDRGPAPPGVERRYGECRRRLSAGATAALQRLARRERVTPGCVVLGAWAVLLSRYSGQDEVIFGATMAGRPVELAGAEGMVGLFINTVPVRLRAEPDAPVGVWLREVQQRLAELRQYEHVPLAEIQACTGIAAGSALFDSLVVYENYPAETGLWSAEPGGGLRLVEAESFEQVHYPLMLAATPGAELELTIRHEAGRIETDAVEHLLGHLEAVLAAMAADPEARLAELPLLTAPERSRLREGIPTWRAEEPVDARVHRLFAAQARRTPEAVAVACGDCRLTYAELDARSNRLARRLRGLGVGPEVLVGLCAERSPALVIGLLAVLKAGGAYVPLDPAYPAERLTFMLHDAEVAVLLTQSDLLDRLSISSASVVYLDREREAFASESDEDLPDIVGPHNLAYVIYTSGSTGLPKGVEVTHGALANLLESMRGLLGITQRDGLLAVTTLCFDIAALEIFLPLIVGARVELVDRDVAADGSRLAGRLAAPEITVFQATPATWRLLLEAGWPGKPGLTMLCGGEALPRALADRLLGKGAALWNVYGPTETTIWSSACRVEPGAAPVSIGQPIAGTRLYVLDDRLRTVPLGVTGELYIGGAGLARGYRGRAGLTAERFLPDPFGVEPGRRLYRTGDRARWRPDGTLECLGRVDDQVKVRGFRVELGEIESTLGRHPGVRAVAVAARPDATGELGLVAYVVPRAGGDAIPAAELRGWLLSRLPEFMIPSVFVDLDALPRTPNGKVDRQALPDPGRARFADSPGVLPPRGPIEVALAEIWAEVLGGDRFGAHDNFFERGGHSLVAIRLLARARHTFDVEVPLKDFLDEPTIAGLARLIQRGLSDGAAPHAPPLERVGRDSSLPASFAQRRLWFFDQVDPASAAYNMPAAIRLEGPLDVAALQRALNEVVRRHEALRTTLVAEAGVPRQVIAERLELPLPVEDLSTWPEDQRQPRALRRIHEEAARPFDLARGPLVRAGLLRLAELEHIAVVVLHHGIADGWSLGVLVREVSALYEAFRSGEPSPLPEPAIQYADYAAWQRDWLQGEVLQAQLDYWAGRLAGLPDLELPTDRPRPAVPSQRGGLRTASLPRPLLEAVRGLGRQEGATLYMTLLAAFQVLLHRYSGQTDLAVGTPVAGRTHPELEGLIGLFVNTLVLRSDLSGDPGFRELLRRVRRTAIGAYAHQDLPFDKLVSVVQPERAGGRTPLFQVLFALQNAPLPTLQSPELTITPLEAASGTSKFDLSLYAREAAEGLELGMEYSTDLFDAATVDGMLAHYRVLLEGIMAEPDRPIGAIAMLTEEERKQMRVGWSEPADDGVETELEGMQGDERDSPWNVPAEEGVAADES